ncbi:hypothetical protein BDV59DRAFT_186946 [Aspergillus ambiguus]|uniref:uncharacterized protein n=1 Tax=Aspergillus ambiguus TaxID=176160 RepID=UPI003CCCDD7C
MEPGHDKRGTIIDLDGVLLSNSSISKSSGPVSSVPRVDTKSEEAVLSSGRLTKRRVSPSFTELHSKIIRGTPRALALSKIQERETTEVSELIVRGEDPWDTFEKSYDCDLAGTVAVCTRQTGCRGPWAIRRYPRKDADRILRLLRDVHHAKVASTLECFQTTNALYTIGRFYPLTLDHIVACKAFPNHRQLAAIMSQFIDGLSYIVSRNLHNPSLDSSGVLMNLEGDIQIARLDCLSERTPGRIQPSDLSPVARVTMQLMQKYVKDDGAIGVDNIKRWPTDSAAVEFLSATTSAGSFEELKKVCGPSHHFRKIFTVL